MSLEYPCVYHEAGMCYLNPEEPEGCVFGPCSQETPSNADRIRTMSDEELAKWLEYEGGGACAEVCGWLDWLRKPAEED
ncbi:MAG: hypothetical protein Q3X94_04185 [Oscillospiraceae bacterium]|nr:hypothetical protein [Oscillospiraceae bacterium]